MQNGLPAITVGQYSCAGAKTRNDDSFGVLIPKGAELEHKGIAIAIADGMSSSEGAKVASETCIRSFLEDYYATPQSWNVKKSVAVVLKATNNWLNGQGQAVHQSDQGMVSTFSGLIIKAGTAHIFHVGDTRISLLRDGVFDQLTRDHKTRHAASREYLTRAIGINPHLEIDYRSEPLQQGDLLIFSSDGVHEHVAARDILSAISAPTAGLDEVAAQIVDMALKNGSPDNLTCQIVRIDNPGRLDAASHFAALTRLPFPPELNPGQSFDGFQILRELHTSKRTQVYLANDISMGQTVVLKTPSINFEDDAAYIEMFTREEWIGRLISSPHVLAVIQPEHARKHLYYVTEYFNGQTLRQWMRDNPRPDLAAIRAIVEQIAKGLRAFHRKDILHQDLKPENIMIDRHGIVKIIDFGSSHAASQGDSGSPVATPQLVGTIDYTAPEYHLGDNGSNRSDIYSLATLTYEMLTGKLPYGRGFLNARDVQRLDYVPMRSVRSDVPLWFDAALKKAVAKKPSERTDALSALVEDLARPNASLRYEQAKPLIERSPLIFWKCLSAALALIVVILLYMIARH